MVIANFARRLKKWKHSICAVDKVLLLRTSVIVLLKMKYDN